MASTSITHENTGDDQDFVAVTSKRSSMKNMKPARRNNNKGKGKGRWDAPVEKPLSDLLQQKIDLLRGSPFLQACQGKLYIDTLRLHFTC